jgi:hypothetical protein
MQVTHGVVGAAAQLGWEVVGFKEGYEGPSFSCEVQNPEALKNGRYS